MKTIINPFDLNTERKASNFKAEALSVDCSDKCPKCGGSLERGSISPDMDNNLVSVGFCPKCRVVLPKE